MLRRRVALLVVWLSSSSVAAVSVDTMSPGTAFSVTNLTAVDIDICALKLGLNFSSEAFVKLTSALGAGVLRVGGTDQNGWSYDTSDRRPFAEGCFCEGHGNPPSPPNCVGGQCRATSDSGGPALRRETEGRRGGPGTRQLIARRC